MVEEWCGGVRCGGGVVWWRSEEWYGGVRSGVVE